MVEIKKKIEGEKWTVQIVTPKEMIKLSDGNENASGLCVAYEKAIYIRDDSVDFETVCHECTHAYVSYLCLSDVGQMEFDQAEEIFCEFIPKKGQAVIKTAKEITKALKKKLKEQE